MHLVLSLNPMVRSEFCLRFSCAYRPAFSLCAPRRWYEAYRNLHLRPVEVCVASILSCGLTSPVLRRLRQALERRRRMWRVSSWMAMPISLLLKCTVRICVDTGRYCWNILKSPLAASQNFEYKMSNILDKPLEVGYHPRVFLNTRLTRLRDP